MAAIPKINLFVFLRMMSTTQTSKSTLINPIRNGHSRRVQDPAEVDKWYILF